MNKTCVYYCEGEDDQKLIDAMKIAPGKILPGKTNRRYMKRSIGKAPVKIAEKQ